MRKYFRSLFVISSGFIFLFCHFESSLSGEKSSPAMAGRVCFNSCGFQPGSLWFDKLTIEMTLEGKVYAATKGLALSSPKGKVLQASTQNTNFFSNFFQPLTSAVSNTITKIQYVFVKGDAGQKGDTGERGPKGETGARGEKGDKGDNGKDGRDGSGATGAADRGGGAAGGDRDAGFAEALGAVAGVGGAGGVFVDGGVDAAAFEMDGEIGIFHL